MKTACLRCGDFLREAAIVPLCERCLEEAPPPDRPVVVTPPPELFWRQLGPAIAFTAAATLLGAWLALTSSPRTLPWLVALLSGGGAGFVLAGLASYVLLVPPLANVGYDGFKRTFVERLGFRADASLALVFLVDRAGIAFEVREPGELALLFESEEGLAFLSDRGTRLVLAHRELESVGVRRLWCTWPPRTAVALNLRDGTERYFAYLDGGGYRANARHARAAAERLRRRAATAP